MRIPATRWLIRIILAALTGRPALTAASLLVVGTFTSPAAEPAGRVSVIRVPGVTNAVKAQCGADGTIHLLFGAEDGPRYVRSQDGGITFSPPMTVVDAAARKPGLKFSAEDLAVGPDGSVHVALSNNAWKLKLPEEEWGFYYARLKPGAKDFSPVRNINRKPSEGFSLAAGKDGTVTAGFLAGKLFTMVSRDGGETFSASAELNPAWNPCDCCTTSTAFGADGRAALLYREQTDNERDIYVALWNPTRTTAPARTRVSRTPWKITGCPMTYFAITPTPTGYVTAWPTKGRVCFARLDPDGTVLPPGEIMTPGTSGMRMSLLALAATDGVTLVSWKNADGLGWQLYDAEGRPQGPPGAAVSPGSGAAGVVLPGGQFVLFP